MADETWQYTSERAVPHGLCCERCKGAYARVAALETALMMIRDREWVENTLDPQWAAEVARDALKEN